MLNNDPATLDALIAAYPDIKRRRLGVSQNDIDTLIVLVDALLAERQQKQPKLYTTTIGHENILNHVERIVAEQYARNTPMYNGEGFEDILRELVKLGCIRETNDDYGYIYYIPASHAGGGDGV